MVYRTPASVALSPEQLIQFGLSLGMTPDQMKQALLSVSSENHSEQVSSGSIITLTVDYSLTLKQMIKAGHYDWVNDFLKNSDPVEGKIDGTGQIEVNLELVHWNEVVSTKEAIKRIKERGLSLAGAEHLLALGAAHPDLQREFPIVALGSVWRHSRGYRDVPYLYGSGSGRDLHLYWYDRDWSEHYRFLVVRK